MEDSLLVFVSSLIGEFIAERQIVNEALKAVPLTRPWVFEFSPASADPLEDTYLEKVRECDLFILLLGQDISDPVKKEWETALAAEKPCLVFCKQVERSLGASAFLKTIGVKWSQFTTTIELRTKVQEAVIDELIKGYRHYRLKSAEVGMLAELSEKISEGTSVGGDYISATIGDQARNVAVGKGITQHINDERDKKEN